MSDLPVVCVFGVGRKLELVSEEAPAFEAREMDCRCYPDDARLMEVLAKDRPGAVVSVGRLDDFRNLNAAPFDVRRLWLHFDSEKELVERAAEVYRCFFYGAVNERPEVPLVSVFTPTYRTGEKISRPWESLLQQTYSNWEWVVMDDSDDGGKTFEAVSGMAEKDCRVRVYRESRRSGRIGSVKKDACGLARGKFLLELDHDDELTPEALELVVRAFRVFPQAGFVYTDCAECFEDGRPRKATRSPYHTPFLRLMEASSLALL